MKNVAFTQYNVSVQCAQGGRAVQSRGSPGATAAGVYRHSCANRQTQGEGWGGNVQAGLLRDLPIF